MIIDKEFESLIPPLTDEEYAGLEQSILAEGCRDALVCWGEVLIDGHNRYRICQKHNLPYQTLQREFTSRDEALIWIMKNQLSRRNLNDFQRIEIVRKCEEAIKEQAKSRQLAELKQNQDTVREILPTRGRATDELGAMAQVSRKTYEHAVKVIEKAPEEVKQACRNGEMSINQAYQQIRQEEKKQETQPKQPVSVFNPTKREERAMRNPDVVERMKEDGSS